MAKKQTWTKESDDSYVQGNYYKKNLAVFVRKQEPQASFDRGYNWYLIARNTYTGDEAYINPFGFRTKAAAIKRLRAYTLANPVTKEDTWLEFTKSDSQKSDYKRKGAKLI